MTTAFVIAIIVILVLALAAAIVAGFREDSLLAAAIAFLMVFFVLMGITTVTMGVVETVANKETVTETTEVMTVTHLDVSSVHVRGMGTRTTYHISVSNENISTVIEVNQATFASLSEGDTVTVRVVNTDNTLKGDTVKYYLELN